MFLKVMLTGVAVAALCLAQGGMGGGGGGMGGGGMRAAKPTKAEQMVNRLKLNKDQTDEMVTILQSTDKDAAPVLQQVMQTRNAVATALISGKSDTEMAPVLKAMSDAQFQMTGVEVKAFQRIVALLKPNQKAKAPEAFDLMAEIFLPQPTSGRGGGRGGAGGGGGGRRGGK